MDPHSRLSQFNQRPPKSGPQIQHKRQMEHRERAITTANVFDHFAKSAASSNASVKSAALVPERVVKKNKENAVGGALAAYSARPIASNSRLRRDEKSRRDVYLAFINNAISEKAKGVNEHYDDLVRQFDPQPSPFGASITSSEPLASSTQLRAYLTALSHVVSKLDRSHKTLVHAILNMPWLTMDNAFVKTYISFIGMLISARPEYAATILDKAASNLTYQSGKTALETPFASVPSAPLTRRIIYDRVHTLLQHLIALVPTLPSTLFPLLVRSFPHKRQTQAEHVTYVRNILRVGEYCGELWEGVMALVVERSLQIDVEIQVELEELETVGQAESGEVFPLDIFDVVLGQEGDESESDSDSDSDGDLDEDDLSSDAGSNSDSDEQEDEQTDVKHVQGMVVKLDSILEVVFKHLERMHLGEAAPPPASLASDPPSRPSTPTPTLVPSTPVLCLSPALLQIQQETRFTSLLSIFTRTILRTFKSRYTQFLLFWYTSLSNSFRDRFLGTVISHALLEHDLPVVTRAAAASYVASYVSRAAFVDRKETQAVVGVICEFLEAHLDVFDRIAGLGSASAESQSTEQHVVFYAATQAVFLIFCFRWRDLMEGEGDEEEEAAGNLDGVGANTSELEDGPTAGKSWIPQLSVLQRVIHSPLNPLKVCSSNVVQQFARVAQKVGFLYCFSILEANRRSEYAGASSSRSTSSTNKRLTQQISAQAHQVFTLSKDRFDADLTTFFPFDPYKLPRSSVYIEGIYREWSSVALDDEDEDDEDEDADEADEYGEDGESESESRQNGWAYSSSQPIATNSKGGESSDEAGALGASFGGMSISPAIAVPMQPTESSF